MKAHKGGYVNKTNEKPVLRGERGGCGGGRKEKGPSGIYCLWKAAPFTLATGEEWVVPSLRHYRASPNGRKTAHPASVSQLIESKKVREGRCRWEPHMQRGCDPLTCYAQGGYTKTHTYAITSQLLRVLSRGFSAWGQRGERLRLGHALFVVCGSGNITR